MENVTKLRADLFDLLKKVEDKPFNKHYQNKFYSIFAAYEEVLRDEAKNIVIKRLKNNVEFMCNLNLADIKLITLLK